MGFLWYCIRVSLYPLAAIVVCGLAVWACRRLFLNLLGRGGYNAVMASSIIGTPVHELGHAAMCLLFRHEILEMVLWNPHPDHGRLGYVRYVRTSDSLYQKLGGLFISAGPIFSGMAVLYALVALAFPDTWRAYLAGMTALPEESATVSGIVLVGLGMIPDLLGELFSDFPAVLVRIPTLLVMLSISLHTYLSPGDVKNAVSVLPLYFAVMLAAAVVTFVLGSAVRGLVLGALGMYHAFMMAMFTVVLVFAALQAALALLIRWIISLTGR